MALVSDKLKNCGVKINTIVCGVPSFGSGVVYLTPYYCNYNYILTTKHVFQEDSQTPFDYNKVLEIEVLYWTNGQFKIFEKLRKGEIQKKLIAFDTDFAIITVSKNEGLSFDPIFVSDKLSDEDLLFFSWGIFSANENELHKFDFQRNDFEMKRLKMLGNVDKDYLKGLSGAGVFSNDKSILHGIICKYPNENFQNSTVDCSKISFAEINNKLRSLNLVELATQSSTCTSEQCKKTHFH